MNFTSGKCLTLTKRVTKKNILISCPDTSLNFFTPRLTLTSKVGICYACPGTPPARLSTPEGPISSSSLLPRWQHRLRHKARQSQPLSIKKAHTTATFCNLVSGAQETRDALPNPSAAWGGLNDFHILKGPESPAEGVAFSSWGSSAAAQP